MCVKPLVYGVFGSDVSHGVSRYFTWVADRWLRKSSFDCVAHRPHEFDLVWVVTYTWVFVFIWVFIRVRMVLKPVVMLSI